MEFLGEVVRWFADAANWSGRTGFPFRLLEHAFMSYGAVAVAAVIALPLGLYVGHTKRLELLVISVANAGRAIPSIAILSLAVIALIPFGLGLGATPTVIALVALAIPPILTNTAVGIRGVDQDTIEAARGMGLTGGQVLKGIEIPLAIPLIVTGVRVAAVQVVATATLAALVAWGGLGRFIVDGLAVRDFVRVFAGALLVALLAILTEALFGWIQRALAPRTTSHGAKAAGWLVPAPEPEIGAPGG